VEQTDRLIRRATVFDITGLSRYMVDTLEAAGDFPARVRVGQRPVFWSLNEVTAFVERTKQSRDLGVTPEARS